MTRLASRFGRFNQIQSATPLDDDQIRRVAPSIFADEKHESRSDRYTYIPTIDVLTALRKEGFQPFMACQTRVRNEGKRDHTKHMLRLRHENHIQAAQANEIVLLNSHDGSSSYQMLAGMFRFVCANGMVCGEVNSDIKVRHNGNIIGDVIDGAFKVLDSFEEITNQREAMQSLTLNKGEQSAFAHAALSLKYDDELKAPPITEAQILQPRRFEDRSNSMWGTLNTIQEHLEKGGLTGRNSNGRRITTRAITGIDQNVKINRALWILAEEMRKLKA